MVASGATFGWVGRLGWWLAVSVSTLVVGLVLLWLVGRGAARILEAGRTRIGLAVAIWRARSASQATAAQA